MRYDDWQTRFWKALDEASSTKFEWGTHDCVLFAAKVADAISDSRYEERARATRTWTDSQSAIALTTNEGLKSLAELVLGPMIPWTALSQGDIALVLDDENRESLAIHDGCQIIGPAEIGVRPIPFRCVKGGWKVE